MRAAGLWEQLEPKLVFGENGAQTVQCVHSGNAQVGIIALSLALSPTLASQAGYGLIPDHLHQPLEQGYIVTHGAADEAMAKHCADYMGSATARAVMTR